MQHTLTTATLAALSLLTAAPATQSVWPKGTIVNTDAAYAGYTLFAEPGGDCVAINLAGEVVHRWTSPVPGTRLTLIQPTTPGHVLAALNPDDSGTRQTVVEIDGQSQVTWSYTMPVSQGYVHHELQRLRNGNTLVMGAQSIAVSAISSTPLIDDFLYEVDPAGNVVWSWFSYQHFAEFGFDATAQVLINAQGGDWLHANAATEIPANDTGLAAFTPGNILVSCRHANLMFVIDKGTGAVVWRSGPSDPLTLGQHYPRVIEPGLAGAGRILVFDNGAGTGYPLEGRARGYSRVLEIDPATKTIAWEYNGQLSGMFRREFYSDIVSNAQRLPNGNTMICSGVRGRLFEVTPAGALAWEYMSPFSALSAANPPFVQRLVYRAHRVPVDWLRR